MSERLGALSRPAVAIGAALLCLVLVGVAVVATVTRSDTNTVTVDFDRTVSLYEGSTVRILGVDVGTVEKLTPRGPTVRARISWDADYDVPADAKALIVSPSVVGDRFVQLAPAYTGGPTLHAARISTSHARPRRPSSTRRSPRSTTSPPRSAPTGSTRTAR